MLCAACGQPIPPNTDYREGRLNGAFVQYHEHCVPKPTAPTSEGVNPKERKGDDSLQESINSLQTQERHAREVKQSTGAQRARNLSTIPGAISVTGPGAPSSNLNPPLTQGAALTKPSPRNPKPAGIQSSSAGKSKSRISRISLLVEAAHKAQAERKGTKQMSRPKKQALKWEATQWQTEHYCIAKTIQGKYELATPNCAATDLYDSLAEAQARAELDAEIQAKKAELDAKYKGEAKE